MMSSSVSASSSNPVPNLVSTSGPEPILADEWSLPAPIPFKHDLTEAEMVRTAIINKLAFIETSGVVGKLEEMARVGKKLRKLL